jgi:hypothetical protein
MKGKCFPFVKERKTLSFRSFSHTQQLSTGTFSSKSQISALNWNFFFKITEETEQEQEYFSKPIQVIFSSLFLLCFYLILHRSVKIMA